MNVIVERTVEIVGVVTEPTVVRVDMGNVGPPGPIGPPGNADTSVDNTFTETNTFQGPVIMGREWLDPRDTRFAGGAACDNSTDDTAAWQALFDFIGASDVMRMAHVYVPGFSVITDRLDYVLKSIHLEGRGWGSVRTGVHAASGFRAGTGFSNTEAMLRVRSGVGNVIERVHFLGNSNASYRPVAGIEFNRQAGEFLPNTGNAVVDCWFGRLLGYDSGQQLQSGILTTGLDENNDQSDVIRCKFVECGDGFNNTQQGPPALQPIMWHLQSCSFSYCRSAIKTQSQIMATNCFSDHSDVADLDISGGLVTLRNWSSEYGNRLADITETGRLIVDGGYFLVDDSTFAVDTYLISENDDALFFEVDLTDLDIREGTWTGSNPVVVKTFNTGLGPNNHKSVHLKRVTYMGEGITAAMLQLPTPGPNHTITLWGMNQLPPDASTRAELVPFFNLLQGSTAAINLDNVRARAWVTPTPGAGWAAVAGWQAPRYRLNGDVVEIEGFVLNNSGGANGGAVFTLPAGFRPVGRQTQAAYGLQFTAEVLTTGVVQPVLAVTNGLFLSINMRFSVL